jgi:hypothetical protein
MTFSGKQKVEGAMRHILNEGWVITNDIKWKEQETFKFGRSVKFLSTRLYLGHCALSQLNLNDMTDVALSVLPSNVSFIEASTVLELKMQKAYQGDFANANPDHLVLALEISWCSALLFSWSRSAAYSSFALART